MKGLFCSGVTRRERTEGLENFTSVTRLKLLLAYTLNNLIQIPFGKFPFSHNLSKIYSQTYLGRKSLSLFVDLFIFCHAGGEAQGLSCAK